MNLVLLLAAIALILPRLAAAEEGKQLNLQLKPKLLASSTAASAPAPFTAVPQSEDARALDLGAAAPRREGARSACGIDSTWCYDATEGGRIVYKPARRFMPQINGLTPENISVKRDRIVFRYSF